MASQVGSDLGVNAMAPTVREMNEYLLAHIQRRRQQPADDLIGKLTTSEVDGERLADEEIVGFAGLPLLAGHITTTALLGNAVLCFDRHPEAAAAVRADRDLLPTAIEEVLRFRSPSPGWLGSPRPTPRSAVAPSRPGTVLSTNTVS